MRRVSGAAGDLVPVDRDGADPESTSNLPAIAVTQLVEQPAPPKTGFTAYAAQVMGQGGQKRGLRGGSEVLDRARSTYLETEYSGPSDRRLRRGRIAKTEI